MPKIEIVDSASGEIDHTIETPYAVGSRAYERLLDGLFRKVDFERFFIRQEEQ